MRELTQRERFIGTLLGEAVDRFPFFDLDPEHAIPHAPASIRKAVTATMPGLLEGGRYLPCLDDRPRSNVPLIHYRLYRRLLEEIAARTDSY